MIPPARATEVTFDSEGGAPEEGTDINEDLTRSRGVSVQIPHVIAGIFDRSPPAII